MDMFKIDRRIESMKYGTCIIPPIKMRYSEGAVWMRGLIEGIQLGRLDVESGETCWEDASPNSVAIEALADGKMRISQGESVVLVTSCSDEMVRCLTWHGLQIMPQ